MPFIEPRLVARFVLFSAVSLAVTLYQVRRDNGGGGGGSWRRETERYRQDHPMVGYGTLACIMNWFFFHARLPNELVQFLVLDYLTNYADC
jgi:hypothetical protein